MNTDRALRILVVDDEEAMRAVLSTRLGAWGFEVALAESGEQALERVLDLDPDLVLSDVVLPGLSGIDLLRLFRAGDPDRPVVLMTAHGTVDNAVEAMKGGAVDFMTKPLDYERLREVLDRAAGERAAGRMAPLAVEDLEAGGSSFGHLVGRSPPMRGVYRLIREVAPTRASVLVTGESGTGKELVARTLHDASGRSEAPFVAVNCAAIPAELMESEIFGHERGAFTGAVSRRAGCFEQADGGTLFLDEIAEMPVMLQPKLLRVLEDGRVRRLGADRELRFDVRTLAATNRPPAEAIAEGRLREDLFYRLDVIHIQMPPLRARGEDLSLLAEHFLRTANQRHGTSVSGFGSDCAERLAGYAWPGNVRELRNVVERGVILAKEGEIGPGHLPLSLREPASPAAGDAAGDVIEIPAGSSLAQAERVLILETLARVGNNKAEAARRLGLDVKTVRTKLKSYGESA
jgi:DNA-binding NtrC family response regulator